MIRAHFEYLIHDTEIEGRNATELALEHLRRLIVVNEKSEKSGQRLLNNERSGVRRSVLCTS
jgi:hypothetical protein